MDKEEREFFIDGIEEETNVKKLCKYCEEHKFKFTMEKIAYDNSDDEFIDYTYVKVFCTCTQEDEIDNMLY